VVQPDGKIVVAGGSRPGPVIRFALARYNPDGSLDPTFSGDGKLTTAFGDGWYQGQASAVALQPDGKLVAAGSSRSGRPVQFALARYNPDGSLDATFSGDGRQTTDFGGLDGGFDVIHDVVVQPDGRLVAAGTRPKRARFRVVSGAGRRSLPSTHRASNAA